MEMSLFNLKPRDYVGRETIVVLETPDITDVRIIVDLSEEEALKRVVWYAESEQIELCHCFIPDNRWLRDWKIRKHLK